MTSEIWRIMLAVSQRVLSERNKYVQHFYLRIYKDLRKCNPGNEWKAEDGNRVYILRRRAAMCAFEANLSSWRHVWGRKARCSRWVWSQGCKCTCIYSVKWRKMTWSCYLGLYHLKIVSLPNVCSYTCGAGLEHPHGYNHWVTPLPTCNCWTKNNLYNITTVAQKPHASHFALGK